jgi:subtilisin family serine protease
MAPDAMIMPLRAFDDNGYSTASQIAKAIRYAAKNGANVINLSLGLTAPSKTVEKAIDQAVKQGVIVVTSAGNNNTDAAQFPAAYSTTISVAATNNKDIKANFSNYGKTISVSAPGVSIVSAYPGGYYAVASGTSFSAPMVSAEAALLLSLTNTVGNSITTGVVDLDKLNPAYKGLLGTGRIDLLKALGGK